MNFIWPQQEHLPKIKTRRRVKKGETLVNTQEFLAQSGTGMPCKTTSVLRLSQMVHQPSVDFIIYNNNLLLIIYYYYHYRYYHYYHYASHIDNSHGNLGFTSCGSRHLCIWHKCTLLLIPEGTQREGKHSKLQLRGNFPWLEAIIHSNKLL